MLVLYLHSSFFSAILDFRNVHCLVVCLRRLLQTSGVLSQCSSLLFGTLSFDSNCLGLPRLSTLSPQLSPLAPSGCLTLHHVLEMLSRQEAGTIIRLTSFVSRPSGVIVLFHLISVSCKPLFHRLYFLVVSGWWLKMLLHLGQRSPQKWLYLQIVSYRKYKKIWGPNYFCFSILALGKHLCINVETVLRDMT